MTDKQKRGRPFKPGKTVFNFRMAKDLRQVLSENAEKSGRSMTEEAEILMQHGLQWQAARQELEQLKRDALKWRDAEFLNVLRLVGYQILRETDGRPTRLVVDIQSLLAEANGLAHGLDSFIRPSSAKVRTAEEERLLLEDLKQSRRDLDEAIARNQAGERAATPVARTLTPEEAAMGASIRSRKAGAASR